MAKETGREEREREQDMRAKEELFSWQIKKDFDTAYTPLTDVHMAWSAVD